jgi:A/G-specific adenine glycosylase
MAANITYFAQIYLYWHKMTDKSLLINTLDVKQFHKIVLRWFDQHGRKALPWQQNITPYRVWISEIMLQQTQVNTVIPYYERFMNRFPNLDALAMANEDEILHLWTGLGYYSRARNLLRAAQAMAARGEFPAGLNDLQNLPGVGRSTAGAIRAIGFGKKAAILDGNVKRVLTRLHGITTWPGEKTTVDRLWQIAEAYTPARRVADYTQAMMDLGATICVRGTPKCDACPLENSCAARRLGLTKSIPQKKPAAKLPVRAVTMLVLKNKDRILLVKRPAKGIWGGLWSLPELSSGTSEELIRLHCQQYFHAEATAIELGQAFRHTFSHYHLDITPAYISLRTAAKVMEAEQQIWYNLQQPANIGLPAPIKALLRNLTPCPA